MKVLTKGELDKVSKRIDELESAIELCDPKWDADVLENAENELESLISTLEKSYEIALKNETGVESSDKFFTRTGVELTVLRGAGQGDGIPRAKLTLVGPDFKVPAKQDYLIQKMGAYIHRARGYGQDGFEMTVIVEFNAKQFSDLRKKNRDPLSAGMAQIKNVVFDATGIDTMPSYAPVSYGQRFPRARKGAVTLELHFDVPAWSLVQLGVDTKDWMLRHPVKLNETLERTRADGHLLAKTAINKAIRGEL